MKLFYVQREDDQPPAGASVLRASDNLFTGESDFTKSIGEPSSLEADLLLMASSIFAADRAYARGEREDICRQFRLSIPVVNYARLYPLIPLVEKALYRLSNDSWQIDLRQVAGTQDNTKYFAKAKGKTLLFSGGLDSLAAAIEFGGIADKLQLVSHITRNRITNEAQRQLSELLISRGYKSPHYQLFVSSRSGGPTELEHAEENSQRTRSFVFLTLGALLARRSGHREILYLAENGQMAIHLPLTHGRVGAFSTHTAHPDVLTSVQDVLSHALNMELEIINPYVHKTKKEVIDVIYRKVPEALPISNSCWMNARLTAGITHCGSCIPCYIRRIAIESYTTDATTYKRNPWLEDISELAPGDDARRNIVDLTELIKKFETYDNETIMSEWPELYSEAINAVEVISMYKRFSQEARTVLGKYPKLIPFLS